VEARKDLLFLLAQAAQKPATWPMAIDLGHELANEDFSYRDIGRLLDEWQARQTPAGVTSRPSTLVGIWFLEFTAQALRVYSLLAAGRAASLLATGISDRKDLVMRVCLFEDRNVGDLEPLTLTRPVFDLLCGQTSLAAKQWRFFGASTVGALVRPHLADLVRSTEGGGE